MGRRFDPDGAYKKKETPLIERGFFFFNEVSGLHNAQQIDDENQGATRQVVTSASWAISHFGWAD
ncbi:MAG: hypothetical protein RI974_430 [Actinomycetota bacterium]